MKETLKQRIEDIRDRLSKRIDQLQSNESEYIEEKKYSSALSCLERSNALTMVLIDLEKALK